MANHTQLASWIIIALKRGGALEPRQHLTRKNFESALALLGGGGGGSRVEEALERIAQPVPRRLPGSRLPSRLVSARVVDAVEHARAAPPAEQASSWRRVLERFGAFMWRNPDFVLMVTAISGLLYACYTQHPWLSALSMAAAPMFFPALQAGGRYVAGGGKPITSEARRGVDILAGGAATQMLTSGCQVFSALIDMAIAHFKS